MITMFGRFIETKRDLILELTHRGLIAIRAKGKILGSPKNNGKSRLDGKETEIIILIKK